MYFSKPKYNEYIDHKFEIRTIEQIICGNFLSSNLLISFLLYASSDLINNGFLMLTNGQIIASFSLFYIPTAIILLKLKKILMNDWLWIPPNKDVENTKLHLVFTSSDHQPNENDIKSLVMNGQWTVSTEKKLRKTIAMLRRRKDTKDMKNINEMAQ